jgi:putative peptide zinc metalloprotease protein
MALCRACRVHVRRDFPYCLHCGTPRPGATTAQVAAPVLRAEREPERALALTKPETTIGRAAGNDLVLDDPSVSRAHAALRRTEDGFLLADLGSANGVTVNGRRVDVGEPVLLPDPATIRIGDVQLRFEQPRDTRIGSRTERATAAETTLHAAGAEAGVGTVEDAPPATEPLTARPRRRSGWALKRVPSDNGRARWVLRNTRAGTYLECDDRDVFLWRLLDGHHTIRDLLFRYAQEYGELALPRIEATLRALDDVGLIRGLPGGRGERERAVTRRVARAVLRARVSIPGVDGLVGRAYRAFGWWFFTPLGVALVWGLAVGGLYGFWHAATRHQLFAFHGGGPLAALVSGLGFLTGLVCHEAAHAFAVKSYGRRVPKAGFMLMFGLPFAFVDTSDMWFGDRYSRVVVALSGPLATLALAGALSLFAGYGPGAVGPAVAYHVATGLYLNTLVNLNPFVPLDGYQAIADALRRPQLREQALGYVLGGFRGGRSGLPAVGLAVYGAAAVLATAGLTAFGVMVWRARLAPLLRPVLPPPWDLVALGGLGLAFVTAVLWRLRRVARRVATPAIDR